DDVDLRVGEQVLEIAIGSRDLMLLGEIEHVVAARGNRRHLRIEPIDPPIGVHVQLGDKAASDKANSDFRHRRAPSKERSSYCLVSCANAPCEAVRLRPRRLIHIAAPTCRSQRLLKNTIDSQTARTIRARTSAKRSR